jgi:hypothetical protein
MGPTFCQEFQLHPYAPTKIVVRPFGVERIAERSSRPWSGFLVAGRAGVPTASVKIDVDAEGEVLTRSDHVVRELLVNWARIVRPVRSMTACTSADDR